MLVFEPIYLADRLEIVNPTGDIGVVTLWTPLRAAKRRLEEAHAGLLDPSSSRVAVISNLYGDGMFPMLCNLLHNPQIRHLVAVGQDLGLPVVQELIALKELGVEEVEVLGRRVLRVVGTNRLLPKAEGFDVSRLRKQLTIHYLGNFAADFTSTLTEVMSSQLQPPAGDGERVDVEQSVPLPQDHTFQPSEVAAHQVVRKGALDCWEELVVRAMRFGHRVELSDGPRLELLNARAVVVEPAEDREDALAKYGFSLDRFRAYQSEMLDPELPDDIDYTYGNRLRGYFAQGDGSRDAIKSVIEILRRNPESRRAYVSLWDTVEDLGSHDGGGASAPCLVTLFFRRSTGRLTLTATYRSHNLLTAWMQNVYGLMGIHSFVAHQLQMPAGPISVISHSLGLDPRNSRYDLAVGLADAWTRDDDVDRSTGKRSFREDPHGYFIVDVDHVSAELVVDHRYGGLLIKRYRADRAAKIERQIIGDMAVSLPSHAMWLGRELQSKETELQRFVEGGAPRQGGPRTGRKSSEY